MYKECILIFRQYKQQYGKPYEFDMAATLVVFLLLFCTKICFAEASVGRGKEYRGGGKVLEPPPPLTTFSCTPLNDYMKEEEK